MTFYNIIFGILLFGAVRELLHAIVNSDWTKLGMAGTLALVIFNDTIYTSHVIEEAKKDYSIPMKLMDLTNFLFLSLTILALDPKYNFFNVDIPDGLLRNNHMPIFWGLLFAYWIIAIIWNILSGVYPRDQAFWKKAARYSPLFFFLVMFVGTAMRSEGLFATLGSFVVLGLTAAYVLAYKPFMLK